MSPATREIREASARNNPLARMRERIEGRMVKGCSQHCYTCATAVAHGRGCPGCKAGKRERAGKTCEPPLCHEHFRTGVKQLPDYLNPYIPPRQMRRTA